MHGTSETCQGQNHSGLVCRSDRFTILEPGSISLCEINQVSSGVSRGGSLMQAWGGQAEVRSKGQLAHSRVPLLTNLIK